MKYPSTYRSTAIVMATLLGGTALGLVAPRAAWSQRATPPNVTLSVKDAEIRDVLTQVFRSARVDFGIDPSVKGRVTLTTKDMPFEETLRSILRLSATPITYMIEGGVYLVKPGILPAEPASRPTPAKPTPQTTISVDLQDAPVRPALEQIFRTAKVNFSIDATVNGTVNLKTTDVPFEKALWLVLRSSTTPLTYTKEDGVYRVKPGVLPADPTAPSVPQPAPQALPQPVALPNLTLDFKDTPIRAALEEIFRLARVDFGIDPSVQGYVNLKVTDMPFESVLKLILRSSSAPLTYSKEEGVYLVKPRTVSINQPQPPVFAQEAESRPAVTFDRIELTYADPVDLAQILNITMIPIGTRYGLKVPGATGILSPGGGTGTRRGGTPPNGGSAPGGSLPGNGGGTVIGSGNGSGTPGIGL